MDNSKKGRFVLIKHGSGEEAIIEEEFDSLFKELEQEAAENENGYVRNDAGCKIIVLKDSPGKPVQNKLSALFSRFLNRK